MDEGHRINCRQVGGRGWILEAGGWRMEDGGRRMDGGWRMDKRERPVILHVIVGGISPTVASLAPPRHNEVANWKPR